MQLLRHITLVLTLCLSAVHTMAQGTPNLEPDTPLVVSITADEPAVVIYESPGDEVLDFSVRALSDDLDTTLALLGPDDELLAYNDDTLVQDDAGNPQVQRNPQLDAVYLAQAGRYRLRVDSFNGVGEGEAELLVSASPSVMLLGAAGTEDTQVYAVRLLAGARAIIELDLSAGQRLTLTARDTSRTLDPVLRLSDAAGVMLAENDDHGSADLTLDVLDAQITDVEIVSDGTYQVMVWDFMGAAGRLELQVTRA